MLKSRRTTAAAATPVPGRLENTAAALRRLEHRWRCAYVRYLPPAILAHVDRPLRTLVGGLQRGVSAGFYLSQPLGSWSGRCAGRDVTLAMWGRPRDVAPLIQLFFDGEPRVRWHGHRSYTDALRHAAAPPPDTDMVVAATTPVLASAFRRRGCLIVPATIRLGGQPETLAKLMGNADESLRSDLRLVRRSGYRLEVRQYSRPDSVTFYERYVVPHARTRFGNAASLPTFEWMDRSFASGFAILAWRAGAEDPDAILITVPRSDALWTAHLGTRDAEPSIMRRGGVAALYAFAIEVAADRGADLLDMGRSRPWLADGVTRYKWKWGFRPFVDPGEPLEWAIRVVRADGAAACRFLESRPIMRGGARFSMIGPDGLHDCSPMSAR